MDLSKLLDVDQLSYKLQRNEATDQSSFKIVMGQQSLTLNTIIVRFTRINSFTYKFVNVQLDLFLIL